MGNSSVLGSSPDEITPIRHSNQRRTLTVLNNADETLSTTYAIVIDPLDVETYDRVTIQIRNTDTGSISYTTQVFGSLYGAPATVGTAAAAGSHWAQIGDDITTSAASGTLKSISTTGLKKLCIRTKSSSGDTLAAGDCIVFLQGTI